jgi:outer membrane protein assembly factor BamB
MGLRYVVLWGLLLSWGAAGRTRVWGQADRVDDPGTAVTQFELAAEAGRDIAAARELVVNGQWPQALALLAPLAGDGGTRLVEWDPQRLLGARAAANLLLAAFPRAQLETYRRQIDPVAKRWFDAGGEDDLRRIVARAYHSRYTDQALLRLGDLACERGDTEFARECWEQLLPPWSAEEAPPGGIPPVPYYPNPTLSRAEVEARMLLVEWLQRPRGSSVLALERFRRRHADESGHLAGREGQLAELLAAESAGSQAPLPHPPASVVDLGGGPTRAGELPQSIDVGALLWKLPLETVRVALPLVGGGNNPFFQRPFAMPMNQLGLRSEVRAVFPVVYREGVFWCDETTIHGVELVGERQGQALWGHSTALFTLDTPRPLPRLAHGAGLPACTVTIAEGRLFARLGRGVAPRAADLTSGGTFSTLVALDLEREGDLLWTRQPEQCGVDVGNWAFEGTPLFHRGRLFVLLRKSAPQVTLQVVCLLPATGQVEWSKPLCTAASMLEDDLDEQHQLLLSASEGSLFCATQLGSVIALDARLGNIEWVARYPHVAPEHIVKLHHRQQLGPSPCVVADGLVLVAPTDSESVWAFQQSSGLRLWQKPIPGQARQVLGLAGGRVIVAADQLWGLDSETGETAWMAGRESPEARTAGRGLLAGGMVYWPRHDEILVVEAESGRLRRDIPLTADYQAPGGGNLAGDYGFLVCAQEQRLLVFAQDPVAEPAEAPRPKVNDNQEARREGGANGVAPVADAIEGLQAGLRAEARRDLPAAAAAYARIATGEVAAADAARTWHGESPRHVARRRGGPVWLKLAQQLEQAQQWAEADRWWKLTRHEALAPALRAGAALQWAESLLNRDLPDQAATVLAELSHDPELVREPRDPAGTRLVGTACEVLLARAREQGGDRVERALAQQRDRGVLQALTTGAPWRAVPWLREGDSLDQGATLAQQVGEQATRMRAGATVAPLKHQRPAGVSPATDRSAISDNASVARANPASQPRSPGQTNPARVEGGTASVLPQDRIQFPLQSFPADNTPSTDNTATDNTATPTTNTATNTAPSLQAACRWRATTSGEDRLFPLTGANRQVAPSGLLLAGRSLCCLDSATGTTRWRVPLAERLVWAGGNDSTVVLTSRLGTSGLNAATGELLWHRPHPAPTADSSWQRWRIEGSWLLSLEPSRLEVLDLATGESRWTFTSESGALGRFWASREGRVVVQQTAPPRTLFFQVDDGYLQSVNASAGHLWLADPDDFEPGKTWHLGRGSEGFHLLELDRATMSAVGIGPRWNELQLGFQAGDFPVSSDAYLALRDERWLSLRDPFSGRSLWRTVLDLEPGDQAPQLAVQGGRVYVLSGSLLSAWHATREGGRIWSEPVLLELADAAPVFACGPEGALVWNRRGAGELRVEYRELRTGELRQEWRLPGRPVGEAVQWIPGGAVLLTDTHVALYQVR